MRWIRRAFVAALFAAAVPVLAWAAAGTAPPACPPPAEPEPAAGVLSHVAAVLKPGGTLNILAVGGVQPHEQASSTPDHPNPFFSPVAAALLAAVHGLHVNVTLVGGAGRGARQQVTILRDALKSGHYQLVIWQTGTVEAVNDEPADDFYLALTDGVDAAAAAGADLALVEPQFSRFLESNANLSPYLSIMQAVSALPGTLLFHRYELMHDWVDAGLIDLESAAPADRPAEAAHLRACLGQELARALLADTVGTSD